MIRNRYNRIQLALNTNGKGTPTIKTALKNNNKKTKTKKNKKKKKKTAQVKSQEDSSFPKDCHKAILNKLNSKSKTKKKKKKKKKKSGRTWTIRIIHNRSIAFERSAINYWGGGGGGGGGKPVLRCSKLI